MRTAACGLVLVACLATDDASNAKSVAASNITGSKIVFSASSELFGERADLFTVTAAGTRLVQITKGRGRDFDPAWSPDRRKIAFVRRLKTDTANDHLMVMGADGRSLRDLGVKGYRPSWSPDGSRIAFDAADRPSA